MACVASEQVALPVLSRSCLKCTQHNSCRQHVLTAVMPSMLFKLFPRVHTVDGTFPSYAHRWLNFKISFVFWKMSVIHVDVSLRIWMIFCNVNIAPWHAINDIIEYTFTGTTYPRWLWPDIWWALSNSTVFCFLFALKLLRVIEWLCYLFSRDVIPLKLSW